MPEQSSVAVAVAVMVAPAGCSSTGQPAAPTGTVTPIASVASTPAADVDREYQEQTFAKKRGITLAEAERRLGWQVVAPDLAGRLAQQPYFAGVWIDVGGGDRVKVGVAGQVTSDVTAEINRGALAVGLTEGYDVVPVRFPLSELSEGNDWLGSQLVLVNAGATASFFGGLRTDLNAARVPDAYRGHAHAQASSPAEGGEGQARRSARGVRLHRSLRPIGSRNSTCAPPLRGGTYIESVEHSAENCTGGFVAKGRVDHKLYLMTAGHCVAAHHNVTGPPTLLARSRSARLRNTSIQTRAITRFCRSRTFRFGVQNRGWLFGTAQGHEWAFNIASVNYSMVGMWVCDSGAATGIASCG